MNVRLLNERLLRPNEAPIEWFPHLYQMSRQSVAFEVDFGLATLPTAPGVLSIRGPRQYGKSTWLEQQLRASALAGGPGSTFYLNGDHIADAESLVVELESLSAMFRPTAAHRRLFIDEITAVDRWEHALKRVLDGGGLRDVLVVTTGSRARDLRRGVERLPGRKGKLERTSYLFTPLSFRAFSAKAGDRFGGDLVVAYLLSGGCPAAAAELVQHGRLPEYVVEMVRDWIFGECAAGGRDRGSLMAVWEALLRRGGTPIGQANLARDAGLANNTVAAGYLELLADLLCVGSAFAWDEGRGIAVRRRPAKFPPTNLLAAIAFDGARLRSVADFHALPEEQQGRWFEWLLAQEIWRRKAIRGEATPEQLAYWKSDQHELDYVVRPDLVIECKRGASSAFEFGWFPRVFPKADLWIVGREAFTGGRIHGRTFADVLLDDGW
ncbi:MAG: ATP-binding protein [Planctomycetes bacterium]|nr:ATP-binding protein [Planctomycetota bacterium]